MAKFEEIAVVVSQKEIAKDIFDLTIQTKDIAKHARAGQFISLYCNDGTKLLPRPISLCEIDRYTDIIGVSRYGKDALAAMLMNAQQMPTSS